MPYRHKKPDYKKLKEKEERERKKRVQKGTAFIRQREKRASQLMQRYGTAPKRAQEQATREITEKERIEKARTPEAIAKKSLEIEEAKKVLTLKKSLPADEGKEPKSISERVKAGEIVDEEKGTIIIEKYKDEYGNPVYEEVPISLYKQYEKEKRTKAFREEMEILGMGASVAAGIGPVTKSVTGAIKTAKNIEQIKQFKKFIDVDKIAKQTGLSGKQAAALAKEIGNRRITNIANILYPVGKTNLINTGKFMKASVGTIGAVYGLDKFLLSPNELAVWTAVDNIGSAIPFQMNDLLSGVQNNIISLEEAEVLIDQAQVHLDGARKFINISTILNPKLWAGRKRLLEANIVAQEAIDLKIELLGI